MNKIKRSIIMPYLLLCVGATVHSSIALLINSEQPMAWLGAIIAVAPMAGFMVYLGFSGAYRTSRYMPIQLICSWIGSGLAIYDFTLWPAIYALALGLAGVNGYIFWYSRLGRPSAYKLVPGATLPEFKVQGGNGEEISSSDWKGSPTLLMFYRGNWCPLCVAQVKGVADQYRELARRGVKVVLISPQPQDETRKLSERFDAPMSFAIDRNHRAAKQLDIFHPDAVPAGLKGYEADSVYPTVVICDGNNRVIWSDLTDNYRVRPDPEEYLRIIDEAGEAEDSVSAMA